MVNGTVQPLVLVVADDSPAQRSLVAALAADGFRCVRLGLAIGASRRGLAHGARLVWVDLSEPGIDGVGIVRRLRVGSAAPILVVLRRAGERAVLIDASASECVLDSLSSTDRVSLTRAWLMRGSRARGTPA
jgi:two-component system KDP operon response regulator KdpE